MRFDGRFALLLLWVILTACASAPGASALLGNDLPKATEASDWETIQPADQRVIAPARAAFRTDEQECFIYPSFLVRTREAASAAGSDIFLFHRNLNSPPALAECLAPPGKPDAVFRNKKAQYFLGLDGDNLFIEGALEPASREILIYAISTQRQRKTLALSVFDKFQLNQGKLMNTTAQIPAGRCEKPATAPLESEDSEAGGETVPGTYSLDLKDLSEKFDCR